MKILLAILLAFCLGMGSVSADLQPFEYDGRTFYYDDDEFELEDVIAGLDFCVENGLGLPPMPPEYEEPKSPITYKGDGSGGDAIQPEYDWEGNEFWLYT